MIFLQETHVKATEQCKLRCSWISQVYQSPSTSHTRGVAILFRKNIPFQFSSMVTDPHGRYIIVSGSIAIDFSEYTNTDFSDTLTFIRKFLIYSLIGIILIL